LCSPPGCRTTAGPGFKSQPRRCRVTVSGKLVTPIVPLFTKSSEIGSSPLKGCEGNCGPGGKYWQPTAGFMTHVTCMLTAKNRDQLRNPTLGNRLWATLTCFLLVLIGTYVVHDFDPALHRDALEHGDAVGWAAARASMCVCVCVCVCVCTCGLATSAADHAPRAWSVCPSQVAPMTWGSVDLDDSVHHRVCVCACVCVVMHWNTVSMARPKLSKLVIPRFGPTQ